MNFPLYTLVFQDPRGHECCRSRLPRGIVDSLVPTPGERSLERESGVDTSI